MKYTLVIKQGHDGLIGKTVRQAKIHCNITSDDLAQAVVITANKAMKT